MLNILVQSRRNKQAAKKFHRSRMVPLHPSTAEHLRYYHAQRADLHYDGLSGSPRRSLRPPPPNLSYRATTVAFQRALLRQALAQAQGNPTAAAQALGLQRTYFQRLLKSLDLR